MEILDGLRRLLYAATLAHYEYWGIDWNHDPECSLCHAIDEATALLKEHGIDPDPIAPLIYESSAH